MAPGTFGNVSLCDRNCGLRPYFKPDPSYISRGQLPATLFYHRQPGFLSGIDRRGPVCAPGAGGRVDFSALVLFENVLKKLLTFAGRSGIILHAPLERVRRR